MQNNERLLELNSKRQQMDKGIQHLAAVEAAMDGIAILNQNGEYIYLNKSHIQLFGYASAEDLIGKTWRELYYLDEIIRFERDVFPILQQQGCWRGEAIAKKQDGSTITEEVSLSFTKDGNLICVCRDITARKQAEAALQQVSEERRRSQQMLELIVDLIPQSIWWKDGNSRFLGCNRNFAQMTGVGTPDRLVGKTDYDIWPKEQADFFRSVDARVMAQNQAEYGIIEPATQEDGAVVWLETNKIPLHDEQGRVIGTLGTAQDITERKQAEDELQNSLLKEKELSELKSRFITMTSHEFRTPLTTILGSTELLKHYSQAWTEEKKLNYLNRMQGSVQHMLQMLDDVLFLGKAEAAKLEFKPQKLDLTEFCCSLIEQWQHSPGQGHQIIFSKKSALDAYMDEKLLTHILGNLLSNAIKYSPTGSNIWLEIAYKDEAVVFQIRDQGIGIPQAEQQYLFEAFYRATNTDRVPGTGLGLAIVKKAVDLHGGKITVESQLGLGTTFTAILPSIHKITTTSSK